MLILTELHFAGKTPSKSGEAKASKDDSKPSEKAKEEKSKDGGSTKGQR